MVWHCQMLIIRISSSFLPFRWQACLPNPQPTALSVPANSCYVGTYNTCRQQLRPAKKRWGRHSAPRNPGQAHSPVLSAPAITVIIITSPGCTTRRARVGAVRSGFAYFPPPPTIPATTSRRRRTPRPLPLLAAGKHSGAPQAVLVVVVVGEEAAAAATRRQTEAVLRSRRGSSAAGAAEQAARAPGSSAAAAVESGSLLRSRAGVGLGARGMPWAAGPEAAGAVDSSCWRADSEVRSHYYYYSSAAGEDHGRGLAGTVHDSRTGSWTVSGSSPGSGSCSCSCS